MRLLALLLVMSAGLSTGCMSPFHADRGALFGGVTGAGVGAIVGDAVGNPAAGAVIGAGVGALTGAAVGSSLDEIEARNQAEIAARMGRPITPGAVTVQDVVAMTQAGVEDELIVTHIQLHGPAQPLETRDLIHLKNNGVSPRVIQALQTPASLRDVPPQPVPVYVEPYPVDPWYGPPPPRFRRHPYYWP